MIADTIKDQITKAMKDGDGVRLSTLKLLSSAITNAEIDKMREKLTEEEELEIVRFEAKKRKDAIEAFKKAQETDSKLNQSDDEIQKRLDQEEKELEILQEFLPAELSSNELEEIVIDSIEQTSASSMADFGKVMGASMAKVSGRADGNKVTEIVKKKLST